MGLECTLISSAVGFRGCLPWSQAGAFRQVDLAGELEILGEACMCCQFSFCPHAPSPCLLSALHPVPRRGAAQGGAGRAGAQVRRHAAPARGAADAGQGQEAGGAGQEPVRQGGSTRGEQGCQASAGCGVGCLGLLGQSAAEGSASTINTVLHCLPLTRLAAQAVQSEEQRERQAAAARAVALLEAKAAKLCEMLSSVIEDTKVGSSRGGVCSASYS